MMTMNIICMSKMTYMRKGENEIKRKEKYSKSRLKVKIEK